VTRGEAISFHYVVDTGATSLKELVLDLGDGQQQVSASASGSFTHAYSCTQALCNYRAELKAINKLGTANVASALSSVIVSVVSRRD